MKYIYWFIVFTIAGLFSCSESNDIDQIIELWQSNGATEEIVITYPQNNSIFPPDIIAPTFLWEDKTSSNFWITVFASNDEIIAKSDLLISPKWQPDSALWEDIKSISMNNDINLNIIGFTNKRDEELSTTKINSHVDISFKTSKDSVNAPVFYRTVTLPFGFAIDHLETISWRLGNISSYQSPPVVLENLPVCGNCHSFSVDGKTIGMDVDYGNDKGSYFMSSISKNMKMEIDNIITWSDYKKNEGEKTFGLLSQVSPDGNWALSTVKDRSIFVKVDDLDYSQLFFPIKGIIGVYDNVKKEFSSLNGANDPDFCQSNPTWSPDGKEILFARAPYYKLPAAENSKEVILPTELARDFIDRKQKYKYDLYKVSFNNGKGGIPEPLTGASNNGKSNFFPKYSPEGKWIVFNQAENFMLLQPDSKLYIMPAEGGEPRLMNCNHEGTMNSWHSWSPNGKWIVFASKERGPYTQLYLTHIDENGFDSPPIFLERLSVEKFACNIPEFVNMPHSGIEKIIENFMDTDNYSFIRGKNKLDLGDLDGALKDINKSLEVEKDNPVSYNIRALIKVEKGDYKAAVEDFNKVIELSGGKFDAYANRATAKFNLHDFEGALADYNKVIELNPKGSRGYFSRAAVKYNLQDFKGAVEDFTYSLKLKPDNMHALYERGISFLQLGKVDEACKDLKKSMDLGHESAKHYWLEYCGN